MTIGIVATIKVQDGKGADFEVLQFGDFKTKAAQAARDAARGANKVPVLAEDFADYCWSFTDGKVLKGPRYHPPVLDDLVD